MVIFRNISSLFASLKDKLGHTATCERCINGKEALYYVTSEAMQMRVCADCAEEARHLGLSVQPIHSNKHAA